MKKRKYFNKQQARKDVLKRYPQYSPLYGTLRANEKKVSEKNVKKIIELYSTHSNLEIAEKLDLTYYQVREVLREVRRSQKNLLPRINKKRKLPKHT